MFASIINHSPDYRMTYTIENTRKYKYVEEWEHEKTKEWLESTAKQLEQEGNQCEQDYQTYQKAQFGRLEAQIASYLFTIDVCSSIPIISLVNSYSFQEERAKRARKINNLLRIFNPSERKRAREIRAKMEEDGAGIDEPINVQVVTLLFREEKYLCKEGNETAAIQGVIKCRKIYNRIPDFYF
ncbi:hypothetical protein WR25_11484 [Diploscapter pachys]|uniref:Uncharacterized protein n=1 Tax=Diploscapter pachys TaxID=2018661 RepID=A0A2A2JPR2_9BILA|nr:hypothetical protein WR25_11484 [Diploscapter pachys]